MWHFHPMHRLAKISPSHWGCAGTFYFCEMLQEMDIPIKRHAFYECQRLLKVKLSGHLELIGK
jgi:hypothetical protein